MFCFVLFCRSTLRNQLFWPPIICCLGATTRPARESCGSRNNALHAKFADNSSPNVPTIDVCISRSMR